MAVFREATENDHTAVLELHTDPELDGDDVIDLHEARRVLARLRGCTTGSSGLGSNAVPASRAEVLRY